MDCAKAVGARIAYPEKSVNQLKGLLRVLRKIPMLIAIPTTAGTGSEVTITAVITDSDKKHKYTMNNFTMIPSYAVLDPEVTYTLPPNLTAATGMDALTHVVEAYIGGSTSKETRRLSLEDVKLIFDNVETACIDGANRAARENMLTAAYKAGADKFIAAVWEMNKRMNIPEKLKGIKKEDILKMAKHAAKEANPLYPVPKLMTAKELEMFYYKVADWS